MKTINKQYSNLISVILIGLFSLSSYAQKDMVYEIEPIQLDTVAVTSNNPTIEKLISKIVLAENFKYRRTLKKARDSKRQYIFNERSISEVEVLKHYKKAARKSESSTQFINYFNDRNLAFLIETERSMVTTLYDNVRKTTFNGYLDEWERVWGD